ncbi:MAG TPA: S41 family peptidase [Candidatus Obscuribacterales bacterium]
MANLQGDNAAPESAKVLGKDEPKQPDVRSHLLDHINDLRTGGQYTRVSDAAPGAAGAPMEAVAKAAAAPVGPPDHSCAEYGDYTAIIGTAERRIYDPKDLGDMSKLESKFDCRTDKDPVKVANSNLLDATGDRFNYAMTRKQWRDMQTNTSGRLGGIGAEVTGFQIDKAGHAFSPYPVMKHSDNPQEPPVINPPIDPKTLHTGFNGAIKGTPAQAAGIRKGDIITDVDGTDTTHLAVDKTVDLIRGNPGSHVHITVERDGQKMPPMDITRAEIKLPTVEDAKDMNGFTYIKMKSFGEHTAEELKTQTQKFPNTKGFIVDLRDNPGGLVDTVEDSAKLFVKNGGIVNMVERVPSNPSNIVTFTDKLWMDDKFEHEDVTFSDGRKGSSTTRTRSMPYLGGDKPVVVITNGNSASAAEIFTGALGDNGARVVGSDGDPKEPENHGTYGKGIGQTLIPNAFTGGATRITTLHYTSPNGTWPGDAAKHRYGIRPDIAVNNPDGVVPGSANDAQLKAALAEIEAETRGVKAKKAIQ